MYLQVAYLLESEETVKREFGNLAKIGDHWPKYVLNLDALENFVRMWVNCLSITLITPFRFKKSNHFFPLQRDFSF